MITGSLVPSLNDPETIFAERITRPRELVVLEEGTCTYRAGERFARAAFEEPPNLVEARSFTEAIELAKNAGRILLLPHLANKAVVEVTYSSKWKDLTQFAFQYSNPPLYLARSVSRNTSAKGVCATLNNLRLLVEPDKDGVDDWLWVDSTQQAATACKEGQAELCITNKYGRDKHDLAAVRELKRMTPIWLPYEWQSAAT